MGNNTGSTGDSIEWHQKKTREYFANCFEAYNQFHEMSDDLINALLKYVNDDKHVGPEAESSKAFVNERQIPIVENAIYCIQKLQSMMMGSGFESNVPLLEDFLADMAENEEAVIKLDHIERVATDFSGYNKAFKTVHPKVTEIHDAVVEAVKNCDEIDRKAFTNPNPAGTNTSLDAFVNESKTSGFVPDFKNKFVAFHEEHSNDIEGSAFKNLLDAIVANIKVILEGLQKGTLDISKYEQTKGQLALVDPSKMMNAEQLDEYLKYLKSYELYLQGLIDRCQVYRYDPVNLSSGNYINDRVDIEIGELDFRRFYNAKSDFCGVLGRGWSCKADVRLREEENGLIKVTFFDGREGLYKKLEQTGNTYYEIHGEIGILKKENGYYRIEKDYGEYEEYDADGLLVAEGNAAGEHTTITYDNSLPVKIEYKNGSYIALSYNEDGILVGVTDSEGRNVVYGYETRKENDQREYFLTEVTYPNGGVRRYVYNESGLIQSVISPDDIVALRNEYDENGRVIHQSFPDGGEMSYSYDDERHATIATEQNGLKVEYLSDELGRHIGTRYVGLNESFTHQDDSKKKEIIEEKYTYNSRSQKTAITDKNGHTTRYSYDKKGHLTRVVGPEGLSKSYTYDAKGRLLSKKDSEGNSYKYTYDFNGNLYSVTDPEGNRTKYDYEDGKLTRIRDAENNETIVTYDDNGNISSITDKTGARTLYVCDKLGRVNKTIDAEGNETKYVFDDNGNLVSVTDPNGYKTLYCYNDSSLLTEVVNPDGTTKRWGYNEIGKPAFYTDENGNTTEIIYNTSWQEENITLPNGGQIKYDYDLLGNVIRVTDPEGRKTVYSHDNEGNILSVGMESGEKKTTVKTSYTYDKRGRVLSETDAEGNRTLYSYDRNGNVICKTDALGGKTLYEYDSLQRVVKMTDAIGRTTFYTYDKNGNVETITDPAGVVTKNYYSNDRFIKVTQKESAEQSEELVIISYEYDSCGRKKREILGDGFTLSYEYDKAGRVAAMIGSNGRVLKYMHDSMGRVIETDDCGTKTHYAYTGTGKLKSITDACGNEIRYFYNELDLLCKVERTGTDSESLEGHVTTFEHDLSGKLICETDALMQKTLYSYDDMGELSSRVDRDGNETIYTRDGNGNITGIRYMDGSEVLCKYNALNGLKEVKEKIGLTKIENDILGRIVKVTDPRGEAVEYEYGPRDEKTAIIYPDGKRVDYIYDAFGKLTELKERGKDNTEQSIKYKYDDLGNLREKLFPNNTSTEYEYYQGGFIKSLVSNDKNGVLDKYEYIYNEKGNATQVKRDRRDLAGVSGIFSYSYDELGRLTESKKDGELVDSYSYDAFGNRVLKESGGIRTTYSYDVLDRLVKKVENTKDEKANTTSYSYDKRGNLIEEYENEVLTKKYGFNMQGLLESTVIDPESELRRKFSYEYNFAGLRVSRESNTEKVHYVTDITMDHNNLIMEVRDGEAITYTYDEDVVSVYNGKSSSFYQMDELGSTMYLTGTDGAAYCSYAYDVFGNRLDPKTGKPYRKKADGRKYSKHGNIIQPFAFTGYREEEDGKYYAQARDYDPTSGRFTGEDKVRGIMAIPDSVNHYLYCINDPITYVDNNGLWPDWLCKIGNGIKKGASIILGEDLVNGAIKLGEKIIKPILEDPCKFLAELSTGLLVGFCTFGLAGIASTACPYAAPLFFAAAGAVTGMATNAAGQLASTKNEDKDGKKTFDWKEFGSAAIGGAIGGGTFGLLGGLAGSLMESTLMQMIVGAISGEAGAAATEAAKEAMNGEPLDPAKIFESAFFGGIFGFGFGMLPVGRGPGRVTRLPNNCTAENGAQARPYTETLQKVGEPRPTENILPENISESPSSISGSEAPGRPVTPIPAGENAPEVGVRRVPVKSNDNKTYHDEVSMEDYEIYDEIQQNVQGGPHDEMPSEIHGAEELPDEAVRYNDIRGTEGLPVFGEEDNGVVPQSRPEVYENLEVQGETSSGGTSDYTSDFELPNALDVEPVAYNTGEVVTPEQIADNVEIINDLWEQGYNAEPNRTQSDIDYSLEYEPMNGRNDRFENYEYKNDVGHSSAENVELAAHSTSEEMSPEIILDSSQPRENLGDYFNESVGENNYEVQSNANTNDIYDNPQNVSNNDLKFVDVETQNSSELGAVYDDQPVFDLYSDEMWEIHNLGQKNQDAVNAISEASSYQFPDGEIIRVKEPVTSVEELSEHHQAALRSYTGGRDQKYNGYKREIEGIELSPYERKAMEYMDDALENAHFKIDNPQKDSVTLYRGSHLDELGELLPYDPYLKSYTLKNVDPQKLVGKTYRQDGYTSASRTKEGALDGDLFITIETPEGSKALDISSLSKLGGEDEVLFHAGQDYEITSANIKDDILHITVKPVESPGIQSRPEVVSQPEVHELTHGNAPANHEASSSGTSSNREVIREEVIYVAPAFVHYIFRPFRNGRIGRGGEPAPTPIARSGARIDINSPYAENETIRQLENSIRGHGTEENVPLPDFSGNNVQETAGNRTLFPDNLSDVSFSSFNDGRNNNVIRRWNDVSDDPEFVRAITAYKGDIDREYNRKNVGALINKYLSGKITESEIAAEVGNEKAGHITRYAETLANKLDNCEYSGNGTLYRGGTIKTELIGIQVDYSNLGDLVGQRFTPPKLLSTTPDEYLASVNIRDVMYVIKNPKGSKAIDVFGGVEMSQNPSYIPSYLDGNELEVLFANTQEFEITSARMIPTYSGDKLEITVIPVLR